MAKRFAFGSFLLDSARGTLTRDGVAVAVGRRGLLILHALLDAAGEPVSKSELMQSAWPGLVVEDSNLSVQVTALRKLLGTSDAGSGWIVTVPRIGYRLSGAAAVEETQLAPLDHGAVDHGGRPSLAVLPFTYLGPDPDHEYLADGVAEAVMIALTRFRWFSICGRSASQVYKLRPVDSRTAAAELDVRYLVEGSLRRSGSRTRVCAQLVDASSRRCLWAERYDFAQGDIFDVQDAIAQQIAGAIEPELLKSAGSRAARRSGNLTAWDLVARGSWLFHHVTQPMHLKARDAFRQAARVDPELTEAQVWIARVSAGTVAYGWSDDPAGDLSEGLAAALKAVQLDEQSPYAHYALAVVSAFRDDFPLARRSAEQAVELSPGFALGHLVNGMAALFSGDAGGAVPLLELGLRLNRHDPQNFVWYNVLALAYLFSARSQEARQRAIAALKVRPAWGPAMRTAAAAAAACGDVEDAARWNTLWSQTVSVSADALQPLWRCNPGWLSTMDALVRTAPAPSGSPGGQDARVQRGRQSCASSRCTGAGKP